MSVSNEKELEKKIFDILNSRKEDELSKLKLENEYTNFKELIFGYDYTVLEDTSSWRSNEDKFSFNIIGQMTPDIVILDEKTEKVRIIIEAKLNAKLHYDIEASQIIRYFLYLLCSTNIEDSKIKRGVFIAAPQDWFDVQENKEKYDYFLKTYQKIADRFNIEIGRVLIDDIL